MNKLTKLLCAALAWALLLGAAVSCAKQPDSPVQDTPKQEDPQPAPAAAAGLRIAVDSEPAWSAAVQWLASEQGQALFGDADVHDVFFLVDPQDIAQQLRLSNYDAAILCPDQQTLQQLGGYESIPLFRDAVIFVHGDIGQPRGDYDLTADTIRQIYAGSGALFWDQEQRQPACGEKAVAGDIPGHAGKQCPVKSQPIRGATGRRPSLPRAYHTFQSTRPIRGATAKMHNLCSAFLQ